MQRKAVRAISGEAQPSVREMNGCYQAVRANRASFAGERAGEVLIKPMEQIEASEAKYRQLLDDINDGCIVVNLEGKIVFANAKMAKILGYKLEELIGETVRKFTPPEFIPYIGEIRKSLEQRRRVRERFEVTLLNVDGNRVSVEVSAKFIEYEGEPAVIAIVRDVTKRKEAEEALRESEELTRGMLESAATGIYIVQGGKFQYVSPLFEEISGYTSEELIGTYSLGYVHSEDREAARERAIANLKGESSSPYEFRFIRKDGRSVWVLEKVASIQYKGERATVASFMDITGRKQVEEALRESEEKYRHLFQDLTDAAFLADAETGLILETNVQGEALLGKSRHEVVGMHQAQLHPPGKADEYRRRFAEHIEKGRRADYDGEIIKKDGTMVPVRISASTLTMRGQRFILGLFRDITERKQAEEEVSRYTKRVEALHAVAKTVSQTLDLDEMLDNVVEKVMEAMDVDAATISVVDERAGEIILKAHRGLSEEFVASVGRLSLEPDKVKRIMKQKRSIVAEEEVFDEANLSKLWAAAVKEGLQSSLAVRLFAHRSYLGLVTVGCRHRREFTNEDADLLTAIANEIAVGIENARLFAEVKAHENGLLRAYEELKAAQEHMVQTERQKALAEMAGGVVHDFNNVLSIVIGRTQLALEEAKEPKLKESLQVIEQSAYDAANMVRRLQEFTGATVGEKLEALDLNKVVKSALQMVETRRAENQVNGVKIDIDADLGEVSIVEGNPAELRVVLVNIIFNAMDALPQGGRITIKTAREDSWVLLSISDTGTGMTEEVKKRIFDPFFTTKGSRGSGLGLSASHGIISKHGGSIEVDSTLGKGSTFYIRLPIFNGTRRKTRED